MKLTYAVVIEQTPNDYGAYAPDVPGCISTAATPDEMLANIRDALAFHIDGLVRSGDPVPAPAMSIEDAIAYHSQSLAHVDVEWLAAGGNVMAPLAARFETVEVEIPTPQATPAS